MPPRSIPSAVLFGLALTGCSGTTPPSLPSLAQMSPGEVGPPPIVGSPTEVYERVARGALGCWFGPSGPLKADYIYHADAEPAGKGGKAEIVVHVRDRASDNQKGLRAYRISISPDGSKTALVTENLKLPEQQAAAMDTDARRWAAGSFGCAELERGGWSEGSDRPPTAGAKPKPPVKAKD